MRMIAALVAFALELCAVAPAGAQIIAPGYDGTELGKVQVAKGVSVTRHAYRVPDNEAPFFNFAKDRQMPPSDESYVRTVLDKVQDRAEAARMLAASATVSLLQGKDAPAAGRRLNQAFLIDAQQSLVYHGYAILVSEHFHDHKFADELMRVAARMNSPDPSLIADHGSVLLDLDRPTEARLLLERAAKANPNSGRVRANLALAVYLTGDRTRACHLLADVTDQDVVGHERDLELLRRRVKC